MGATRPEQVRNFFAAFGVVLIIFHVLRGFSAIQRGSARRRRRPARRRQPARRRVVRRVRSW